MYTGVISNQILPSGRVITNYCKNFGSHTIVNLLTQITYFPKVYYTAKEYSFSMTYMLGLMVTYDQTEFEIRIILSNYISQIG